MKIYITDICALCCPDSLDSSTSKTATERIKARVAEELAIPRPGRAKHRIRTLIVVAAIISLFATSAAALSRWFINFEAIESEEFIGYRTELDGEGNITGNQKLVFPDAGMLFSFTGPADRPNMPEFRCFWLPSEPDMGSTDTEGWSNYLSDSGKDYEIPYIVEVGAVSTKGHQSVLNGKVSIQGEEYWGEWYVLKLCSDYRDTQLHWGFEEANYILLFNENQGFLVTVSGTSDMETLEHIARELEIRDSGNIIPTRELQSDIGQIDIGRG